MTETPKAKDVLKQLQHVVAGMVVIIQGLDKNDVPKLLSAYKELHEIKAVVDEAQILITEQHHKLSYEVIPDAFETLGFDSVKRHGKNFVVSVRINASIPAHMREAGYKWLRDEAKVPELIVPAVNPKSLSAFVKEYFETNAMWPPEDAIKVHKQRYTAIRKT